MTALGSATAGLFVAGLGGNSALALSRHSYDRASVAVSRLTGYERAPLKAALQSMFENLGGLRDIIKPGDHVGLKINLTGGHYWASTYAFQTQLHPGETYWTHPEVLRAVGELVLDAGAGRITIVEAVSDQESYNQWDYHPVGTHLGAAFVDLNLTLPSRDYVKREVGEGWFIYPEFTQNRILDQVDCLVSIAKSKRHDEAGVTHGMKNLVGTLPVPTGLYNAGQGHRAAIHNHHSVDGNRFSNLCRVILDLNRASPIGLVVNDAISTVLGGEGPWGMDLSPASFNTLVASKDPVAADVVATQVIGFDPEADIGSPPFPDSLNYLRLAGDLGMGTASPSDIDVIDVGSVHTEQDLPDGSSILDFKSFPNPFDQRATLEFSLASSTLATITVRDIRGRRIRRLTDIRVFAGQNRVEWDGRSDSGVEAPAGMYVATVEALGSAQTIKLSRIN